MANNAEGNCGEDVIREGEGEPDCDPSLVRTPSVDRKGEGKRDREADLEIFALSGSLSVERKGE